LYSIGFKLSTILSLGFIEPFRKTWPAIFFPKAQDGDAKEVFSRFATYFLLAGSIVSVFIICISDHLIQLMGSREYWNAYAVVPILVSSVLIHGFQATINLGLFVKNKTKYAPLIVICGAVSNIVFNALLIPRYGMIGAGTGTMLSHIVMLVLTYGINQKIYPIHYEYRRLSQLALAYIFIWIVNYSVHIQSFWWAIPFKAILFVSFILILFITRFFTDRELEVMKETYLKYSSLVLKRAG
ncbi:MAG: polysaccharide biosynthesis C-terminal domain-containing protein, partial [Deltaproteobacteria bacterium]|nr:polysaccharide biosynthesis C-terminal domain-containing protein [Deltaproteobacteria bacterium]